MFETAVVNEPSVFEPLKFYCISGREEERREKKKCKIKKLTRTYCRVVLGKLPVQGRPTIWITVWQGATTLAVGAGGGCLDIFTLIYPFSPLSPSLWETARYRLKYCLKGPLNPK